MRYFAVIIPALFFAAGDAVAALESAPANSCALSQKTSSDAPETGLPLAPGGKRFFPLNQNHIFRLSPHTTQAVAPVKNTAPEVSAIAAPTAPVMSSEISAVAPALSSEPITPVRSAPRHKSTSAMSDDQAKQILSIFSAN